MDANKGSGLARQGSLANSHRHQKNLIKIDKTRNGIMAQNYNTTNQKTGILKNLKFQNMQPKPQEEVSLFEIQGEKASYVLNTTQPTF